MRMRLILASKGNGSSAGAQVAFSSCREGLGGSALQIPHGEEASAPPGMDLSTVISGIMCVLTTYKWHSANDIILTCLLTCHSSSFLVFLFFCFFSPLQQCKSDSCRESHKDALACLDFQQYYYEKYINLSVWKGFKGCCIHLLPEPEHLITQTRCCKKMIPSSQPH